MEGLCTNSMKVKPVLSIQVATKEEIFCWDRNCCFASRQQLSRTRYEVERCELVIETQQLVPWSPGWWWSRSSSRHLSRSIPACRPSFPLTQIRMVPRRPAGDGGGRLAAREAAQWPVGAGLELEGALQRWRQSQSAPVTHPPVGNKV